MNRQQPPRQGNSEVLRPAIPSLESEHIFSTIIWTLHYIKLTLLFLCPSFVRNILVDPVYDGLSAHGDSDAPPKKDRNQRYAHLDGLRGLAALSVFVLHLFSPFDLSLGSGYGPEPWTQTIFNLPIIRLVHSGQAMVKVFFVISGFVLTVKPAEHIVLPQGSFAQLQQHLGISILKRGIRLFLPPMVTTFCAMCLAYLGAFMTREEIMQLPTGLVYLGVIRRDTFILQVWDWAKFLTRKLSNPWVWLDGGWHLSHSESIGEFSIYGPHLWTIQTEFMCSMVLFIVIAAVARVPQRRLQELLSLLIILYCTTWGRWDVALFISGMLCCIFSTRQHVVHQEDRVVLNDDVTTHIEARHIPDENIVQTTESQVDSSDVEAFGEVCPELPVHSARPLNLSWWPRRKHWPSTRKPLQQRWFDRLTLALPQVLDGSILACTLRQLILWMIFAASLWLLSYPEKVRPGALGFENLRSIRPDSEMWQSTGAVLLVWVISKMPVIQHVLMSSIVQYLGKNSFAFYLIHVPVLESVGWRIANAWRVAAERLQNGNESGNTTVLMSPGTLSGVAHVFMFSYVFLITVYFADFVWMYVDRPTMGLLRTLQSSLTR